jgi:hypothetical protein
MYESRNRFKYKPIDLQGPSFRLLKLLPGIGWDRVRCEIFDASFEKGEDAITYEALSYTWGGTERTEEITMDERRLFVTPNLLSALKTIRYTHTERVLWIDAICIDQENVKE